jgi:AcrR family transcriptional regulator
MLSFSYYNLGTTNQEQRSRLLSAISVVCDHRQMSDTEADARGAAAPSGDGPASNANGQAGGAARRPSVPRTARERARAEITREILDAARGYLATDGAAGLSLRAIARDLGMASSALYRYFASRDELLTRLIIDAYDSLGAAAEARETAVDRNDLAGRFTATCEAVRAWALAHPNEYALIYGSPVPGYVAPADTIQPASRVTTLLLRIIVDAAAAGRVPEADIQNAEAQPVAGVLAPVRSYLPPGVPAPLVQRALMVWTNLFGVVSFELFGQLHSVVAEEPGDRDAFFTECIRRWLAFTAVS